MEMAILFQGAVAAALCFALGWFAGGAAARDERDAAWREFDRINMRYVGISLLMTRIKKRAAKYKKGNGLADALKKEMSDFEAGQ